MKAQLVVGGGAGDLPSVPGLSEARFGDTYPGGLTRAGLLGGACAAALGLGLSFALRR